MKVNLLERYKKSTHIMDIHTNSYDKLIFKNFFFLVVNSMAILFNDK